MYFVNILSTSSGSDLVFAPGVETHSGTGTFSVASGIHSVLVLGQQET